MADLPWGEHAVAVQLRVRKLFCDNAKCKRRILTERLPGVAAPWAHKTARLLAPLRSAPTQARESSSLLSVVGAVWVPGLALAVSGVGFAAVTTFTALLFAQQGWQPA